MATIHRWKFTARFRARAFGWRSQPAITRVKVAVAEIKKAARADPAQGAEGAVLFIERISSFFSGRSDGAAKMRSIG